MKGGFMEKVASTPGLAEDQPTGGAVQVRGP